MSKHLYILLVSMLFVACVDEKYELATSEANDALQVGAFVLPGSSTRANDYYEEGPIATGTYHLYYPPKSSNSTYRNAFVDFGADEYPTTGFAYFFNENGERKDLKWRNIYSEGVNSQTFYLTNVDTTLYTLAYDSHWQHERFNKKDVINPYQASPLDTINGTNDLLFGTVSGNRNSGRLNFQLDHAMSLLKINIEVYNANDGFKMSLDNAEMTITNLSTELGVFDMRAPKDYEYNTSTSTTANSGGGGLNPKGYYRNIKDVKLVDPEDENLKWAAIYDGVVGEDYADNFNKRVYESLRWMFPPQSIPTNSSTPAPVLIIKVPLKDAIGGGEDNGEYKYYQGPLPTVMFEIDEYGNNISSPEVLSLKSGCQINITASINSPETELVFAPATIEAWVSKGSYTVTTKQAGIYNSTDFYNAARLFKEGNYEELERFGSFDGELYSLQIWSNLNLDYNKVFESMKLLDDNENLMDKFEFMFNGYTVKLLGDDGEEIKDEYYGAIGQEKLYNLVTGRDVHNYNAIRTTEDFMTLFNIICDDTTLPDIKEIKKYGYFNNMDNTFLFDIQDNISLDIEDIFMKMPKTLNGFDIQFVVETGKLVSVNLPDTDITIPYQSTDRVDKLSEITKYTSTPGFHSPESFLFMKECYNEYYYLWNEILSLYGAKTLSSNKEWTGAWTLYLNPASLTLSGDDCYVSMVPNGSTKPNYTVKERDTNGAMIFTSDYVPISLTRRQGTLWQKVFSGSSTTSSLANTASYYSSNNFEKLWGECGYFDEFKWHFPLTSTCTSAAFVDLFGKMITDFENRKWNYEFVWDGDLTITGVPLEPDSEETTEIILTYPEGEETLKSITNGTFWENIHAL